MKLFHVRNPCKLLMQVRYAEMYAALGDLYQVRINSNREDSLRRDTFAQTIAVTQAAQDLSLHVLIHPEAIWQNLTQNKITSFWLQTHEEAAGNWKISLLKLYFGDESAANQCHEVFNAYYAKQSSIRNAKPLNAVLKLPDGTKIMEGGKRVKRQIPLPVLQKGHCTGVTCPRVFSLLVICQFPTYPTTFFIQLTSCSYLTNSSEACRPERGRERLEPPPLRPICHHIPGHCRMLRRPCICSPAFSGIDQPMPSRHSEISAISGSLEHELDLESARMSKSEGFRFSRFHV